MGLVGLELPTFGGVICAVTMTLSGGFGPRVRRRIRDSSAEPRAQLLPQVLKPLELGVLRREARRLRPYRG